MALTKIELIPRVRNRVSGTDDDMKLTDALVLEDVNNALTTFALERDWPWLEATNTIALTAGTDTYALPANCLRIHVLSLNDSQLDPVQYRDLISRRTANEATPRRYAVVGNNVVVQPTPSTANDADDLALYYQRTENVLVADADAIICPDHYADVIVTFASIFTATRVKEFGNLLPSLMKMRDEQLSRIYDVMQRSTTGPRIMTRSDNYA